MALLLLTPASCSPADCLQKSVLLGVYELKLRLTYQARSKCNKKLLAVRCLQHCVLWTERQFRNHLGRCSSPGKLPRSKERLCRARSSTETRRATVSAASVDATKPPPADSAKFVRVTSVPTRCKQARRRLASANHLAFLVCTASACQHIAELAESCQFFTVTSSHTQNLTGTSLRALRWKALIMLKSAQTVGSIGSELCKHLPCRPS